MAPTGLIPWFSKTEGNTYAALLHHTFLFKGKPTQCSRGSKKDFWRHCRGGLRKVKSRFGLPTTSHFWRCCRGVYTKVNIPSTHHKPLSPALHYLPFASRFPLLHFTLAVLFALSFPFASFLLASCLLVLPCAFYMLASSLAENLLIWIHLKCSTWIIFDPYALVLKPQLA